MVWWATALTIRSQGTLSKKARMSRSITQSLSQQRREPWPVRRGPNAQDGSHSCQVEDRLQLLLQQHRCCGLGHPVGHVRRPGDPDPFSLVLRYLDGPHRSGHVAASAHPIPELVEVVPLVAELGDAARPHPALPR